MSKAHNWSLLPRESSLVEHDYVCSECGAERNVERADVDRLAAENAALREALEEISRHPIRTPIAGRPDLGLLSTPSCQQIAFTALQPRNAEAREGT